MLKVIEMLLALMLITTDSLQIKQIVFFSGETQSALTQSKQKYADKLSEILCSEGEPAIVFNIFGQNGFGGNSQDYIIYIQKWRIYMPWFMQIIGKE